MQVLEGSAEGKSPRTSVNTQLISCDSDLMSVLFSRCFFFFFFNWGHHSITHQLMVCRYFTEILLVHHRVTTSTAVEKKEDPQPTHPFLNNRNGGGGSLSLRVCVRVTLLNSRYIPIKRVQCARLRL